MLTPTQRNDLEYWVQNKYGIALGATPSLVQPEDIPDAAAVWVADDIAQSDGSAVSSWLDRVQAITADQATSTEQPIYRTSGINGQPAIDFDGSNDVLGPTASVSTRPSGHIFVVAQFDNISQARCLIQASGIASLTFSGNSFGTGAAEIFETLGPSYWFRSPSNSLAAATSYLLELNSDGSLWEVRINGAVQTLTDVFGVGRANVGHWFADDGGRLRLGNVNSLASSMDGKIATVIVIGKDPPRGGWGRRRFGGAGF